MGDEALHPGSGSAANPAGGATPPPPSQRETPPESLASLTPMMRQYQEWKRQRDAGGNSK